MEALSILKEKVWDPFMGLEEKKKALRTNMKVLISRRDDIMAETKNAEIHSSKKRKTEVDNWLNSIQKLEREFECFEQEVKQSSNLARIGLSNRADKIHKEVEDLLDQGKFSKGILLNADEEKVHPLVTTNVKGQAFEQSLREVLVSLNEVSSIGIYGMGGVGKTTLAMHIHNHLLNDSRFTNQVYWVTVSQDYSITKVQNDIAKSLNLDISTENDDKKRAAKLFQSLTRKKNFVLILDDVWIHFDVKKVGIPLEIGGGKLIITSRSVEVCNKISCQKKVKLETLSAIDSWELFLETLGHCEDLPVEVKEIAKKMTKKCDGMPLGLITMAASMRGVKDVFEWRDALEEFTESCMQMENMNDEVFPILHCSYNRLRDPRLQKCFLYCCLYPEDYKIERGELIRLLIVEELLVRRNNRKAEFDQGHAVLNKLERACLLESVEDEEEKRCVRMHDLMREMALQIARDESKWMVKAGAQLREMPGEQEWSEDLEKVSLMENDVRKISLGLSHECPRLTTLSLLRNNHLREVLDPFFVRMPGLRVLDLSYTAIRHLPSSVTNLESLSALLLRCCYRLRIVPPLNKLKKLIELDLLDTIIEEVPQGLESLVNLRCLDMRRETEPSDEAPFKKPAVDILARLSNLQCLLIPFVVQVEDLLGMRELEVFRGKFVDVCSINRFVKHRRTWGKPSFFEIALYPKQSSSLIFDRFEVGQTFNGKRVNLKHLVLTGDNVEMLCYGEIEEGRDVTLLPIDTQELVLSNSEFCNFGNSFLDAIPSLIQSRGLRKIQIEECNGIEFLMRLSNSGSMGERMMEVHGLTSTCNPFQSLEELHLVNLDEFTGLCKLESREALPPAGTFSHLWCLDVSRCDTMKKLIPRWLLQYLLNLTEISVADCKEMEEIITEDETEQVNQCASSSSSLPRLQLLCLYRLPKLKSIYKGRMTCVSIKRITTWLCPKLKRLPFILPFRNGKPSAPPALECIQIHGEEWDSLEWDHPQYKNLLQPFVSKPWS